MKKTGVALDKQRIVFKGRKLKDEEIVGQLGLENGNVLHLIASLDQSRSQTSAPADNESQQSPEQERSPARESSVDQIEDEVLGEVAEQEILAGILRTLSTLLSN
jgi:Ubiquitin family